MKLKEWYKDLQDMIKERPEILEWDLITSKDDEGNGYNYVHYGPATCLFDEEDREVIAYEYGEGEIETPIEKHNVVILN